MAKFSFLVVEGPHDIELVYRLLSPFGLSRTRLKADLDPYWYDLVPTKFPHNDDLLKRVPVPVFVENATHSIAIYSAIGDSRLAESVQESYSLIETASLNGIGIILDADLQKTAASRYADFNTELNKFNFNLPAAPGTVNPGPPRLGAFVLPDNAAQGTLENILLECAQQAYPDLLASARIHVATVDPLVAGFPIDERRDFQKPAGGNKATIGSITSILRPGKSMQVSLQDNQWLRGAQLTIPRVKAIQDFLKDICEIP